MHTASELDRRAKAILSGMVSAVTRSSSSISADDRRQEIDDIQLMAALIEGRTSLDQIDDDVLERWDAAVGMNNIAELVCDEHMIDAEDSPSDYLLSLDTVKTVAPKSTLAPLPPEIRDQIQQCIATAMIQSRDDSQTSISRNHDSDHVSRPSRALSQPRWYVSAVALFACAASLAAIWVSVATWRTESRVRDELITLRQDIHQGTGVASMQVTSDKQWRNTSWNEIWNNNVSGNDSEKHNLDRLRVPEVLPPELTNLIAFLKAKSWNDAEILACLRILMTKDQSTSNK